MKPLKETILFPGSAIKKFTEWIMNFKLKRDYLVFLGFFLLSTMFWLLKSLNKNYESEMDYPIRFTERPAEVIFENDLPKTIELTVRDAGFQLLKNSITPALKALNINVKLLLNRKDRKLSPGHYFILTNDYKDEIAHSLPSTSKLISIYPDTLHLNFSRQVKARLPVRLLAKISAGRQRIISGNISFQPDSVTIYGSGRIIDTLKAVYTNYQDFKNLQDTLHRNVGLKSIEGIEFLQKRVNVTIPVETFTEKVLEIPVTGEEFPDSLRLRAFPGIVKVSFFVGVSDFSSVNANNFKVFILYHEVEGQASGEVALHVESSKRWISNIRVNPEKIDYLLELKK